MSAAATSPSALRARFSASRRRVVARNTVMARNGVSASDSSAKPGSSSIITVTMPPSRKAFGIMTARVWTIMSWVRSTSLVTREDKSPTRFSPWKRSDRWLRWAKTDSRMAFARCRPADDSNRLDQ